MFEPTKEEIEKIHANQDVQDAFDELHNLAHWGIAEDREKQRKKVIEEVFKAAVALFTQA